MVESKEQTIEKKLRLNIEEASKSQPLLDRLVKANPQWKTT